MIVIYSLLFGFTLHCLKNKLCPKSWEPKPQSYAGYQPDSNSNDIMPTDESQQDDAIFSALASASGKLNKLDAEFAIL